MRIGAGYGLALTMLLVISCGSYIGLRGAAEQFKEFEATLAAQGTATEIDMELLQVQTLAREFAHAGDPKVLAEAKDHLRVFAQHLEEGEKLFKTAEERALRDELAGDLVVLSGKLDQLRGGQAVDEAAKQQLLASVDTAEMIDDSEQMQEIIKARAKHSGEDTRGSLARAGTVIVILATIGTVLSLLIAWTVGRSVSRPVVGLTGTMGRLADGDHGVDIPGTGRGDELGRMAQAVLVFKENMIRAKEAEQAFETAQREARAQTMEQLSVEFDREVGLMMNSVASAATEMQATASSMTAAADEASAQATAAAVASEQASANVQTVASAAEELSASIAEISRQVSHSAEIASKAVTEAERTNVQIQGLTEAAQRIGDVVQLITDIAGQTNLLALNATIEAARAGDAGKGFAVVASEVKNLANETAKATEQITGQITAVQHATREAVTAIQSIGSTIGQISEISAMIAEGVEQQGAATREIAANVAQASAGTYEVSSNIGGVSQAASSTGASAKQVLGVANELSEQAELLRGKVVHFLSGIKAA
ncbi:methyl-accepting chemotaxis protein [Immundisolibacter sp.]|uniref:methyl-accepting chemotaxis protein n=2 Tax=Immundisolibacter sp. TaxID=1934948 RepID=UPI003D0C8BD3